MTRQLLQESLFRQMSADEDKMVKKYPACKVNTKSTYYEPRHKISNNVVCATSKASDQTAHTRSLIRAFAGRLIIL